VSVSGHTKLLNGPLLTKYLEAFLPLSLPLFTSTQIKSGKDSAGNPFSFVSQRKTKKEGEEKKKENLLLLLLLLGFSRRRWKNTR
jgi:hypothetical protein